MTVWLSESITIEPPIPHADLRANDGFGTTYVDLPSSSVRIGSGDIAFRIDDVHPSGPCATAIIPNGEAASDPTELLEALHQAVADFACTNEGTVRSFTGYLGREDGDGVRSRLYIRDGAVITQKPVWTEPSGEPTGIVPVEPTASAYPAQASAPKVDTAAGAAPAPDSASPAEGVTR